VENTTGELLYDLIKSKLKEFNLSLSNLVGQCYDGASNMSGEFKGLASRIKADYVTAVYVHCYAHRLNLALQDACKDITEVRNTLGQINSIYNLIEGSTKRHYIFEKLQIKSNNSSLTLKYFGDTRWSSCVSVLENYEVILDTLKEINLIDKNSMAFPLYLSIFKFDFIFYLDVLTRFFNITNILSIELQTINLDYSNVKQLADSTINCLVEYKKTKFFEKFWNKNIKLANDLGIDLPSNPRIKKKPKRFIDEDNQEKSIDIKEITFNSYCLIIDKVSLAIKERFESSSI
ncbi:unnamed protein product, partial [Brachionus calyciflorus]